LTIEQIINIARQMRPRSMAKKLEGTVKEILGFFSIFLFKFKKIFVKALHNLLGVLLMDNIHMILLMQSEVGKLKFLKSRRGEEKENKSYKEFVFWFQCC